MHQGRGCSDLRPNIKTIGFVGENLVFHWSHFLRQKNYGTLRDFGFCRPWKIVSPKWAAKDGGILRHRRFDGGKFSCLY